MRPEDVKPDLTEVIDVDDELSPAALDLLQKQIAHQKEKVELARLQEHEAAVQLKLQRRTASVGPSRSSAMPPTPSTSTRREVERPVEYRAVAGTPVPQLDSPTHNSIRGPLQPQRSMSPYKPNRSDAPPVSSSQEQALQAQAGDDDSLLAKQKQSNGRIASSPARRVLDPRLEAGVNSTPNTSPDRQRDEWSVRPRRSVAEGINYRLPTVQDLKKDESREDVFLRKQERIGAKERERQERVNLKRASTIEVQADLQQILKRPRSQVNQ